MELSRYLKVYPSHDKEDRVLLCATRRCAVLECSSKLWERIKSGGELSQKESETLTRLGVLVPDRAAEQREVLATFETASRKSPRFNLLVTLTLECNLACPYCFEDPFRGQHVMNEQTADLLVERVSEKMAAGLNATLDFYGGEALMALPMLKRISAALAEAAKRQGVGFSFNIISNGTLLTRAVVEELLPLGLSTIRTTLDGPPEIHDCQRPFISGKGSFHTILENVKAIYELVPVEVGSNYARHNYQRYPELLDLLLQEGLDPTKLKAVVFAPVMPKADGSLAGGDFSTACASTEEEWMIEAGLFLREEALRRGFPVPKIKSGACMIEFKNDLVIGYDGSLYKCPVFMGQEEMRIGSLQDGVSDYHESHNMDIWKNDECLECPYLPLCFGGCRFFRKLNTGSIDGVDCRRKMLDASLEHIIRQDLQARPSLG